MSLMATILAALAAGAVAPLLIARAPRLGGWLLAVVPAAATVMLAMQSGQVVDRGPVS